MALGIRSRNGPSVVLIITYRKARSRVRHDYALFHRLSHSLVFSGVVLNEANKILAFVHLVLDFVAGRRFFGFVADEGADERQYYPE